jgi:hypothetical protein
MIQGARVAGWKPRAVWQGLMFCYVCIELTYPCSSTLEHCTISVLCNGLWNISADVVVCQQGVFEYLASKDIEATPVGLEMMVDGVVPLGKRHSLYAIIFQVSVIQTSCFDPFP